MKYKDFYIHLLKESSDLELRRSELSREIDIVFNKLQDIRKNGRGDMYSRYADSEEYISLKRQYDKLHDELEYVMDELEPKATEPIRNPELINFDFITNILKKPQHKNEYTLNRVLKSKTSEFAVDFINLRNEVIKKVKELTSHIPYVDIEQLKYSLLFDGEHNHNIQQFFPVVIEVSASADDDMQISLTVDYNGKLEMFEGNDEASEETIKMVNKLLNPSGKQVRIYASHDSSIVLRIKDSGKLPKDLYVSPSKEYAEGYADLKGTRSLFTGVINVNDVSQESNVDWKTIDVTEIKNVRILN